MPSDIRYIKEKIWNTGRNMDSLFIGAYDGFREVKAGRFAFFCEEPIARQVMRKLFEPHEICSTKVISFQGTLNFGIVLKKFAPLRERLLINWIWVNEVGITRRIFLFWNTPKLVCTYEGHFESVRIEYVALIFLLLFSSFVLAIVILMLEIGADAYRKKLQSTIGTHRRAAIIPDQ